MAALGAAPSPPPKSFFQSSKSLKHWRTEIVPESSIGVQNLPMDAENNFSFGVSFRKCHLTHQDTTCPPSLALDHWRTGRVLERSLGVWMTIWMPGSISLFVSPSKMSFNLSRFHLSSISGVESLEDRNGSKQEAAF